MGAAATAADLVVTSVLAPERCARLVEQSLRDPALPSLEEVLESMTETAFNHLSLPPDQEEIRRVVQRVLVDRVVDRIVDPSTPAPVRSRLEAGLATIQVLVETELADSDGAERIHLAGLRDDLIRFRDLREWKAGEFGRAAGPPPGDPIGGASFGCSQEPTLRSQLDPDRLPSSWRDPGGFYELRRLLALVLALLGVASFVGAEQPSPETILEQVRGYRAQHEVEIVTELAELVALPNIAADLDAMEVNAEHLTELLEARRFSVSLLRAEGGPPVVYAERASEGAGRTVVFYAHYDGQPVVPELWHSDPWEVLIRTGRIEDGRRGCADGRACATARPRVAALRSVGFG